ncbi:MAG TPA: 30S ribosomal protein S6 [Candidatus Hydrogenedens sp.]|nr:30S ribosomal protein S6 [Candidatus Hydrogenedens sp.]HOK09777.1 30S ribosomal protein S6 [Candidatus Hydrogenedens sp.]
MSLRTYEALFIVSPEVEDDDVQAIARETENLVVKSGGVIVRSEVWGRRRLAYKVKKFTEGIYILIRFQSPPNFIARLENYFRLSEQIIRYIVVYFDEKTLRLEAEQEQRRKELLEAGYGQQSDLDKENLTPIPTHIEEDEEEEE